MTIQFHCPGCGRQFNVGESMGGTRAACQQCGTILTVPLPGAGLQMLDPLADAPAGKPGFMGATLQEDAPGVPPIVWYLVGGGAMFVLFTIGVAVLFQALRSPSQAVSASPEPAASSLPAASSSHPSASEPSNVNAYSSSQRTGSFGSSPPARTFDDQHNPFAAPQPMATAPAPASLPVAADPATPPATLPVASPPASKAGAEAAGHSGGAAGELRIPFSSQHEITFGPLGCPVVIVGQDVWHLEQKRRVGRLQGEAIQRGLKSLSGDGQWFAAATKSPNQQDTGIKVWNVVTGELCCEIPPDPEQFVDVMLFSRNQYLLVGGRSSNVIQVWDVTSGRQMSPILLPGRRLEAKQFTISADGQYFTTLVDDRLTVMETSNRKTAAVVELPPPLLDPQQPLNNVQLKIAASRVMSGIEIVRFSPDGQELAAITESRQPRLVCWNSRGKLIDDQQMPQVRHVFFFRPAFEWLPDGSGWIISGHIYDRSTHRIVFAIRTPFGTEPLFFPLDRNRLVGAFPNDPKSLQVLEIPWDRIHASLQALNERVPAMLAPYEPVGVEVQLAGIRGDAGTTESLLRDALAKRLQEDGIQIQAGRPTTFRLRFSEQAGDTVPIYERQSPFDFRGRDTGRTATEAEGSLVVELAASDTVLWRDTIQATSASQFQEEINDATVRKSMLENITRRMNQLSIPYFIPQSADLLALPIVME